MTHPGEERLFALVDGELAPAEAAEVRAHVEGCAACGARLRALEAAEALSREAGRALGASPAQPVPAAADARVLDAVRATVAAPPVTPAPPSGEREGSPLARRRRRWPLAAVGLAAAAAFVAAGLWLRSGSTDVRRAELVAVLGDVTQALPAQARGGAPSAPLEAAAADVAAGRLEVRQRDRCTPDEIARYGASDGAGRLRVFAVRYRGGAEAHLWDEGGREVAAASVRDGREVEPLALSRAGAEAALAACGGAAPPAR